MKKHDEMNVLARWYLPWRYPCNWWKNIKHFIRSWKWAYQRVTRGYADCDVWNLDCYYSTIIPRTLRALAASSHGYPMKLVEDIYGPQNSDDEMYKLWQNYLIETAAHFEKSEELDSDDTFSMEIYKESMEELQLGFDMLIQAYRDLWD